MANRYLRYLPGRYGTVLAYESCVDKDTEEDNEDGAGVRAPEVGGLVLVMHGPLLLLLPFHNLRYH